MTNFPNFYIQDDLEEVKHFGYGNEAILNVLKLNSCRPLSWSGRGDFRTIISLCLMLSGDIHPCPGPVNNNPANIQQAPAKYNGLPVGSS